MLISGFANEKAVKEAKAIGVHEFLKKPFTLAEFQERLTPHVEKYLTEKDTRQQLIDE